MSLNVDCEKSLISTKKHERTGKVHVISVNHETLILILRVYFPAVLHFAEIRDFQLSKLILVPKSCNFFHQFQQEYSSKGCRNTPFSREVPYFELFDNHYGVSCLSLSLGFPCSLPVRRRSLFHVASWGGVILTQITKILPLATKERYRFLRN